MLADKKINENRTWRKRNMNTREPQDERARAYVLVEIQPGKEKEFGEEILSRGLLVDSKVERLDFVHGPFDFVIILCGTMKDIDVRLIETRKSPFVRKTETLICFEMFDWEDIARTAREQS
jgi:hypothetical protein